MYSRAELLTHEVASSSLRSLEPSSILAHWLTIDDSSFSVQSRGAEGASVSTSAA